MGQQATACCARAILKVSIDSVVKHAARLISIRDGAMGHSSRNLWMSLAGSMHSYSERTTKYVFNAPIGMSSRQACGNQRLSAPHRAESNGCTPCAVMFSVSHLRN